MSSRERRRWIRFYAEVIVEEEFSVPPSFPREACRRITRAASFALRSEGGKRTPGGQRAASCAAFSSQLKVNSRFLFFILINEIFLLLKVFYKKRRSSQPLTAAHLRRSRPACLPSKPDSQFSRTDDPASSAREAVMAAQ
ncbi:hypothetical protein [Pseudomonas aeruginosa]|uniref:hypothetical protein n=1 Tax=Pseudomonas aeruginosa TaxID=287 RepID=UPI0013CE2AA8|nr:hypothetical protein [Pseudomonas aeruginosa]